MPHRGINFNFEPNELVLCFEPDPTKAKVLYYAKILEQCVGDKDRHGRRKPEYMIHFQGWNSSWDRIVPESFVLKNDDENRALMRHLASTARQIKRNKIRRRRIDEILKKHFKRSRIHDDSETEESSSEDSDDSDYTEMDTQEDHREQEEAEEEETQRRRVKKVKTENKTDTEEDGNESDGSQATTQTGNEDQEDEEETDEDEEPRHIDLELPENLRRKLEEDCMNIKMHNKLVHLPASPNIVTLLEGYVKNFGVNILCATGEKNRGNNQCIPPDRNIGICKELVDGLRVIFDFTLPTLLLYTEERKQFEQLLHNPPAAVVKKEEDEEEEQEEQQERVSRRRRSSHRLNSPPASSSPKLPRLFPSTSKDGRDDEGEDDEEEDEETEEQEAPRRITRHAYQEEVKRIRRDSSGGSGRATRFSITSSTAAAVPAPAPPAHKSLSERVTPPPPLLLPSHVASCPSLGGSQPNTPPPHGPGMGGSGDGARSKEAAVNNIFSWRMFKDDYHGENTPCMLYGPHHLLRLLVKLPDILAEMHLPDISLKHLIRHLEMFIDYLSNRSEELFPECVYCESAEA